MITLLASLLLFASGTKHPLQYRTQAAMAQAHSRELGQIMCEVPRRRGRQAMRMGPERLFIE